MEFSVAKNGQALTVALQGDLDFTASRTFAGLLRGLGEVSGARIIFDLSDIGHIDSIGLGLLYIAQEKLDGVGASMSLARPQDGVMRLLKQIEAEAAFQITP